jgi:hypothetical protein
MSHHCSQWEQWWLKFNNYTCKNSCYFIWKKTSSLWGRGNISQCHLGQKYERGREKRGKCKIKRKTGEREKEKGM